MFDKDKPCKHALSYNSTGVEAKPTCAYYIDEIGMFVKYIPSFVCAVCIYYEWGEK